MLAALARGVVTNSSNQRRPRAIAAINVARVSERMGRASAGAGEAGTDARTVVTRGSTFDNRCNLAHKFLSTVLHKYGGTRLGRQELEAEFLEDIEGALWKRGQIEALRIQEYQLPSLNRIVVAIDP